MTLITIKSLPDSPAYKGYKFEVNVPARLLGKRLRSRFHTRAEAEEYASEMRAQSRRAMALPVNHDEALFIHRWRDKLTLAELEDAASQALVRKEHLTRTVRSLAYDYMDWVDKRHRTGVVGDLHARDVERIIPKMVAGDIGDKDVQTLDRTDLQEWVDGLDGAARTRRNHLNHLRAVLSYGVRIGVLPAVPSTDVDIPPEKRSVQVVSPEDLSSLLSAAYDLRCESTFWFLVFGAYAGLRTSEIERLEWGDIRPEAGDGELYVRPGKTKNAERWVSFTPPLQRFDWYRKPKEGLVLGGLLERNRQPKRAKVYAKAGFRPPTNSLRHSFASNHLVYYREPVVTAVQMGHHSPTMTFAAYRRAVSSASAKAYWEAELPAFPFPWLSASAV